MIETGLYSTPPDTRVWLQPHYSGQRWIVRYLQTAVQFDHKRDAEAYRWWLVAWLHGHFKLMRQGHRPATSANAARSARRGQRFTAAVTVRPLRIIPGP
jgi:hypothetical protein